jgi:hypothetical protein
MYLVTQSLTASLLWGAKQIDIAIVHFPAWYHPPRVTLPKSSPAAESLIFPLATLARVRTAAKRAADAGGVEQHSKA